MDKLSKIVTDAINHPYTRVPRGETPWERYQAATRRMDNRSADYADLCKRWPRLIDAYNAQTSAYGELDAVARKYDYEMTIANLELAKIGLA